jgi:hypothetical protein
MKSGIGGKFVKGVVEADGSLRRLTRPVAGVSCLDDAADIDAPPPLGALEAGKIADVGLSNELSLSAVAAVASERGAVRRKPLPCASKGGLSRR